MAVTDSCHILLAAEKNWYEFQLKPLSHTQNQEGWLNHRAWSDRTTIELFPLAVNMPMGTAYSLIQLLLAISEPHAMWGACNSSQMLAWGLVWVLSGVFLVGWVFGWFCFGFFFS